MTANRALRRLACGLAIAAGACADRTASAEPTQPRTEARTEARAEALAQALFEEGVALMAEERFEEACPKLAESQHLDPGGGTLLNLASCLEQLGQLASAYAMYNDALSAAIRDGRTEREATARERLAKLQPRVSRLELRVVDQGGVEPDVELDGTRLGPTAWQTPLPIDPGTHALVARADGRVGWQRTFEVVSNGERIALEVPRLAVAAPPSDVRARQPWRVADPPAEARPAPRRTIALATLVSGGVLFAAGLGSGALALAAKGRSDDGCPTPTTCTPGAVDAMGTAETFAWTANVAGALGLVGIGVGAYLLVTTPKRVAFGPGILRGSF